MNKAITAIHEYAHEGTLLRQRFFEAEAANIANISLRIALALAQGGKILFCGNGGSAADCQHLAAEFVNRFLMERPPLPAIALTTDTSAITAISNDFGFSHVFSKQVMALGKPGDVLIGISTSGNSENILAALTVAKEQGLVTVGLTGKGGGTMASLCDFLIAVDHDHTPFIQEIHIAAGHLLCSLSDYYLFENVATLAPYLEKKDSMP